jgi:alkylation response protein AidB-like acyl-CoA dehydrogenase
MVASCAVDTGPSDIDVIDLLLPDVKRFLARDVDGAAIDRDGEIPRAVRDGVARLGLFGMTIPETYGGGGLRLGAACRVISEVARVDRSVAIMIGLHVGLGTRGLVELGADTLRSRWLPLLASGQCIASFAATEAGAGSDLTAIRTTGRTFSGGLRIDGEKSYVTNGRFAGLFTLLVRTPGLGGDRAHSLVCVPADARGVLIGKEEDKLGIRGSSTVPVSFDGVIVPTDHILGSPGRGLEQAHALLVWGRTLMSAGCVGAAQGALDATLEYVAARRQFGHAIGEFAATRAHVAWMVARKYAMESLVRSIADAHARGESIETDSAIAKVFCSEGAFETCDRAVQLHGAVGFLEATGVARLLRDCRVTRIFEGANDVLLLRIGAALLAESREVPITRTHGMRDIAERVKQVRDILRRRTLELRARWGVGAVRHQLALQRIARAEICARAAAASLSCAKSRDEGLAGYAAATLLDEATGYLDQLSRADQDEAAVQELGPRIYE